MEAALEPAGVAPAAFVEISAPKRSSVTLKWKFRYFWKVGRSMTPNRRTSSVSCSRMTSQVRCATRASPVMPTNMWWASSVSMNRQVRASGSNADSASEWSWNLPSRSVRKVNMNSASQSGVRSLKAVRMRGRSASPERRSSSAWASSRPSRPKWACRR